MLDSAKWVYAQVTPSQRWLRILGGAIVLAWILLNWPVVLWFVHSLQMVRPTAKGLVIACVILLGVLGVLSRQHFFVSGVPTFRLLPVALLLGGGVGAVVSPWLLSLEQLPAALALVGTYGLLGLFFTYDLWRRGLPIALALAGIVPATIDFSVNLGFPLRMVTAELVEWVLHQWHLAALTSEDVIVLDNSMAQVDLPCSGLKGLGTGTLFLLLATWLEGRSMGLRWFLVCGMHWGLLVLANAGRVLTLVITANVLQQPAIAETLHTPLGVLGFVAACLLTVTMLRWVPKLGSVKSSSIASPLTKRNHAVAGLVLAGLVGLALVPQPTAIAATSLNLNNLVLPQMQTQPLSLTETEQDFFGSYPGSTVQKIQFQSPSLSGAMLLVASPTWKAHHPPELCHVGNGLRVNHMEVQQLTPSILGRWLTLNDGARSATYWFQSPHRTTDDFLDRIWGEVSRRDPTWVMVSIVFDQAQNPDQRAIQTFLTIVHATLDQRLQGATL
jgi:exosortase O